MNETTTRILIELSVLAFFGLLYYIWQRRKILRNDLYNAYQEVDQLIYNLSEFLKEDKNSETYQGLDSYIQNIDKAYKSEKLEQIYNSLCESAPELPEEISDDIDKLKEQIRFHLKK